MSWTDYEYEKQFICEEEKTFLDSCEVIIPAMFNSLTVIVAPWTNDKYDIYFKNTYINDRFRSFWAKDFLLKKSDIIPFINSMPKYLNKMEAISEVEYKKIKRDNFKSFNFLKSLIM